MDQQPNFDRAAQSLRIVADDFERCANLPAVTGGVRLMQMMEMLGERLTAMERTMGERLTTMERTMGERLTTMERTMRTGFADLDGKIQTLDTKFNALDAKVNALDRKVTAADKNSMARIQNSIVMHDNVDLAPLYSLRTGEVIPNCPPTLEDLDNATSHDAARLLREMDVPVPRAVDQRRRQLRTAFGVRARA